MPNPDHTSPSITEFFAQTLAEHDGTERPSADVPIERAVELIRADRDGRSVPG